MRIAVITGAGSGIGRAFAELLSSKGYKTVLVGRQQEPLKKLASKLFDAEVYSTDLNVPENCLRLFEAWSCADMVINSAGCGVAGEFSDIGIDRELQMLDINVRALHILTKLYTRAFIERGQGSIINVASSAAFFPGPLYASYYATKSYVYRLTTSVHDELKKRRSVVKVSVLCPGPVDTEFNSKAGVSVGKGAVTAEFVAKTAIDNLGKRVIVPGFLIKCSVLLSKIVPERLMSIINYRLQTNKKQ